MVPWFFGGIQLRGTVPGLDSMDFLDKILVFLMIFLTTTSTALNVKCANGWDEISHCTTHIIQTRTGVAAYELKRCAQKKKKCPVPVSVVVFRLASFILERKNSKAFNT